MQPIDKSTLWLAFWYVVSIGLYRILKTHGF